MRRSLLAFVSGALLLVVGPGMLPAHAQSPTSAVQIRDVDSSAYPILTLTVAVAGSKAAASPGNFLITEDGKPAPTPAIRPFSSAGQAINVVLLIDTSGSMQGSPLTSAVAAARQFLDGATSDVSIGLVTFADTPTVVQPITDQKSDVAQGLSGLRASGETSLYDGVIAATKLFAGPSQRNIILLSDGGDTKSTSSLAQAVAAAKRSNAAIFSIGLKTSETDVGALKRLANSTKGQYVPAAEADLSKIYQGILTTLTQQYLLTYQSTIARGGTGTIAVTTAQGTDTIEFKAPAAVVPSPTVSVIPPPKATVFASDWVLTIVLGLTFLAAFVLVLLALAPSLRVRREREIGRRVGTVVTQPSDTAREQGLSAWLPTLVAAGNRLANAGGWTLAIEQRLEQAGLSLTAGEVVVGCFIFAVLGGVVGGFFFRSVILAPVFAVIGGVGPFGYLDYAKRRRLKKLQGQLPDILMILASSLRAGHSFLQALDSVSKEAGDPGGKEFARVVAEIRLGRPMEEAMNALADRVGSEDFAWAILAVNIQRQVGGNLAEIL
ncbi:MAG TPA: VWA domain-containing protein, partial [Actinomycetota bacterium]|nr:VWA domain-containing protein [Actinomycetota bacterium]